MTSVNILLKPFLHGDVSRESGTRLRLLIIDYLTQYHAIEIDFTETTLTPSFADEAFGLLCHHLTRQEFNERIKIHHLTEVQKVLLNHVIGNRFLKHNHIR